MLTYEPRGSEAVEVSNEKNASVRPFELGKLYGFEMGSLVEFAKILHQPEILHQALDDSQPYVRLAKLPSHLCRLSRAALATQLADPEAASAFLSTASFVVSAWPSRSATARCTLRC